MQQSDVIAEVVRRWVTEVLPGQLSTADQAVCMATASYESGTPIPTVCREVTEFVNCRVQHPAYRGGDGHALVLLAS